MQMHQETTKVDVAQPFLQATTTRDVRLSRKNSIILACDQQYGMPLATALRSIAEHNNSAECLDVAVLTSTFSDAHRDKVLRSVPNGAMSIRWVPIDLTSFATFNTRPCISKMTYARLVAPLHLPPDVSRALYIDADTLILSDLRPLWEMDLQGAVIGAVIDIDSQKHSHRLRLRPSWAAGFSHISSGLQYFNAGVLLIDIARWREMRISERALEYMTANPDTPLADQDALNVACAGLWTPLDPAWNYQRHFETRLSSLPSWRLPKIVHFIMDIKPWDPGARSLNARFYDDIRSRTCFARTPKEKVRDLYKAARSTVRRRLRAVQNLWRRSAAE